ncbi:MAG: beta-lactamase family protein [Fibrobacter sp.]|jgi:CubicO group peptidase (beta-lactamase class C family)|nr:beta-lactamase family protein [Fibrobacter sp.]
MDVLNRKIRELLASAVSEKIFNRAVAGYVLPNGKTQVIARGTSEEAVFDIASLTKVCPTSALALKAILEEKLSLDTPVFQWIPEFQTNFREQVLVRHLLTHSLDYRVPMSSLKSLAPPAILETLYRYTFLKAPGSVFNYGNPASILLGILLSRLYREPVSDLGRDAFFKPLGMARSGWFPLARVPAGEVIPTENCPWRGRIIHGEVHDESAFVLGSLFPVGSAGMFSCVPDLLKFLRMILRDGVFDGQRIVPAGLLSMVSAPALENVPDAACSLGFEYNAERFMGNCKGKKRFGKTGFTGASMVADAELSAGIVLLSDFTYPLREKNADRINAFRSALSELFFESVGVPGSL